MGGVEIAGDAGHDEVTDAGKVGSKGGEATRRRLGDGAVAVIRAGRREDKHVHGGVEVLETLLDVAGKRGAAVDPETSGQPPERLLAAAGPDEHTPHPGSAGQGVKEEVLAALRAKLADGAGETGVRWYAEPHPRLVPSGAAREPRLDRGRQDAVGPAGSGGEPCESLLHLRVGKADPCTLTEQPTMKSVIPQVPLVADAADEGGARAGMPTPQRQPEEGVVVRQMGVDEVETGRERADAGDICAQVGEGALLDQDRMGLRVTAQTRLQVVARPVGEVNLHARGTQRLDELEGGRGCPRPAVGGDELEHAHDAIVPAPGRSRNRSASIAVEGAMPVDPQLLEILVCPLCKADLELVPLGGESSRMLVERYRDKFRDEEPEVHEGLKCSACHRTYPIVSDIPVMLVDEALAAEA